MSDRRDHSTDIFIHVIQHNKSDILKIITEFYKNLYISNNKVNHLDLDLTNKIKDDLPVILESEIATIIKKNLNLIKLLEEMASKMTH